MRRHIFCYTFFGVGFLLTVMVGVAQPVSLPDFSKTSDLPAFISSVYSFALTVVGIAVFIRVLQAGFLMLTAAGNAAKWGDARTKMQNAVIGAILLFAAYLILYVINPDLVKNTFNFTIPGAGQPPPPTTSVKPNSTPGAVAVNGIIPTTKATSSSSWGHPVALAQEGIYVFTIKVTDRNGDTCRETYNMEVVPNITAFNVGEHSVAGKYSATILNAVKAQEEGGDVVETIQGGGCVITTQTVPDAIAGVPYYAEIYAAGQAPFVYEIEDGYLPDGLHLAAALEMPVLTIKNLTAQRTPSYVFYQTDTFRLEVTNAKPNSTLYFKWIKNGAEWFYPGKTPTSEGWTAYGMTDGEGKWVNEAAFTPAEVGSWQEYVMVDGKVSRVLGFEVIEPRYNIVTSPNVPAPTFYGAGSGGYTPCQVEHYCEDPKSGEKSPILSDAETIARGSSERCPGLRQVFECVYPDQEPNDECRRFDFERRGCMKELNDARKEDGTIDTSTITHSDDGEPANTPAGTLYTVNQYQGDTRLGGDNQLVLCRYSDQELAVKCGMSQSGEYCLPNRTTGWNQSWCVR